ncbi:hypothetical protein OH687_38885 (plasmid) [Burkholderia anthina]|nr:hypothetical protein OH687_38885 [Burkholderia anthina]
MPGTHVRAMRRTFATLCDTRTGFARDTPSAACAAPETAELSVRRARR